jgi:hypothetical protein
VVLGQSAAAARASESDSDGFKGSLGRHSESLMYRLDPGGVHGVRPGSRPAGLHVLVLGLEVGPPAGPGGGLGRQAGWMGWRRQAGWRGWRRQAGWRGWRRQAGWKGVEAAGGVVMLRSSRGSLRGGGGRRVPGPGMSTAHALQQSFGLAHWTCWRRQAGAGPGHVSSVHQKRPGLTRQQSD